MNKVFILLGGNIGDRKKNISMAEVCIEKEIGKIISRSSIYETEAWGRTDQSPFLNKVIKLQTEKDPHEILNIILHIEEKLGRIRNQKWEERIIDIDILFLNDLTLNADDLKIPHPHIQDRRFTLVPLNEIAEEYIHPIFKKTMKELLEICTDSLNVIKLEL